ncbi:YifB family Mg chelatase-like AAA ATPase [Rubritalea marina]|uniref:YifB family Mg chelatase-like AAA ATPase n=1 Tax=Rubritalea marina TaxID=361055 RepID=UPI00036825B1|nr:YifB family Mg chelatase-like AAA ATPase [Rubritalea marina]
MLVRLFSAALQGADAIEVDVEVNHVNRDKSSMQIVGLPDAAVRESAQRVTSAVVNTGLLVAMGQHTINLAPADLRKEGPSFDLPVALAIASCGMEVVIPFPERYCIVGELALDGRVRPVKGVISVALEAMAQGRTRLIVPSANCEEASLVEGIEIYGVDTLEQAWKLLIGELVAAPHTRREHGTVDDLMKADLSEVRGQHQVKRALEVAAAGGHNLLMVGPPGTGKSMIAKRIPSILPEMSLAEAIETTKIHSCAGGFDHSSSLQRERPFRAPHHTISDAGLLGGGSNPLPGEVSLAHHGVLFLDELPEFRRQTLEVLRQPLEDRSVSISRAAGSIRYPCNCMLVAALNPCPCGYYGDLKRMCRCSPNQIEKYRQRISGPLLDRIDIHIEVPAIEFSELRDGERGESSASVRQRVAAARQVQQQRYSGCGEVRSNSMIPNKLMDQHCALSPESVEYLEMVMHELNFSARAYNRILKVSRTIADLAASPNIELNHLMEAVQYRTLDRKMMG